MNNSFTISLIQPGLLIAMIVIVHASLQAGASVLTLLSGHSLRKKHAHARLVRLNLAYIAGVIATSFSILLIMSTVLKSGPSTDVSPLWPVIGFAMIVMSLVIMTNYYRRGKGTILWLPRSFANYLSERARKTKSSIEAGALGGMTVIAELPISLLLFLTITLLSLNTSYEIWWNLAYSVAISLPLMVILILVGGGHRISQIQRWREQNKSFIKYNAGFGMIVAAIYIISFYILEARQ